MAVFCSK